MVQVVNKRSDAMIVGPLPQPGTTASSAPTAAGAEGASPGRVAAAGAPIGARARLAAVAAKQQLLQQQSDMAGKVGGASRVFKPWPIILWCHHGTCHCCIICGLISFCKEKSTGESCSGLTAWDMAAATACIASCAFLPGQGILMGIPSSTR